MSSFSFSNFHDYSVDFDVYGSFLESITDAIITDLSVLNISSVVSIKVELTWFVLVMVESSEPGFRGMCFHWKGFSAHLLAS